ncbi:MAG: TolC family protein [Planctomycetia bacterium]|nr:TolC family protein [Planctomycetia bacterium]
MPAEPRPLLLDQAIDMAWRFNPRLDALRERIAAAEGGRQIAAADFLPEATSTYRHLNGAPGTVPFVLPTIPNYVGNLAPGPPSDRFDRAELSVQWILWDFGRTSGKVGQAVSAVDIARLQFERARQTVAFDVTAAYFGVLAAQANGRIAEEAVARADSVLRDARNFFQRGAAIRNDVLRADMLRAEMQLNLVKARTSTAAAVAALNQSIGINVSCPTQVVDQSDELPFRLSLADCLQLAADNRDEFRVVLNAIRSSRLGVGVAQAEFLPRVLVGGVGLLQQTRNGEEVHLAAGGVNLEMALFEGGRRVGKLRSAEADVRVAIAQGKDLCDRIAYEVNLAFLGIQDARQRIDLSRTTVAQANENLRVVRRLVEHGDATSTDLIDAVLLITRAQQNYAAALYDYQTSLARLTYATGLPNTPGLSSSLFASRT